MISVMIETRTDEDGFYIDDIGDQCRHDFVRQARLEGGIWLATSDHGVTPFIPWEEITSLYFDDNTCDGCLNDKDNSAEETVQ